MECFLGEIRSFAFTQIPQGWAPCDGRVLPVNQNRALFELLGNRFGGETNKTFALPDLRDSIPVHRGTSLGVGRSAKTSATGAVPTVGVTYAIALTGEVPQR